MAKTLDAGDGTYLATPKTLLETTGDILDLTYPVGSIYMSVNVTSPASLFGGTWERIRDTFLLAAGDTYSAGTEGGEATHTLTTSEMPSHAHDIPALSGTADSAGSHSHTINGHTHSIPSLSGTAATAGAHTHSAGNHTHSIPSLSGTAASSGNHSHKIGTYSNNSVGGTSRRVSAISNADEELNACDYAGNHTHNVTTNSSTTGYKNPTTSSSGNHSHSVSTTASTSGSTTATMASTGAHTHSVTTTASTSSSVGSGSSFSTMPPYLAVYIWKRTA